MIIQDRMTVIEHQQIAHNIFELTMTGCIASEINAPGQFVHIRVADSFEPLLRRPLSIASFNKERQEIIIIYRAEGKGTSLLAQKRKGDQVDVLGPLGNGFSIKETEKGETALLVGGGIGVPPLFELSKQLTARGVKCIHILGFQSENVVFYENEFKALGETYVVTVDGTAGTQGFVTTVLDGLKEDFATYYSCGPLPMLQAVQSRLEGKNGFLSFEQRMGCGIGACFACVCQTTDGIDKPYVKVCSDGPVFPAGVIAL